MTVAAGAGAVELWPLIASGAGSVGASALRFETLRLLLKHLRQRRPFGCSPSESSKFSFALESCRSTTCFSLDACLEASSLLAGRSDTDGEPEGGIPSIMSNCSV